MHVKFKKAEIIENENGSFLHLELQAFISGTKVIIKNVFPSTNNYAPDELPQLPTDNEVVLKNTQH